MKQITILAFLLISIAGYGQTTSWYKLSTPVFEISFPNKPTASTQQIPSAVGELTLNLHMLEAKDGDKEDILLYMTNETDYPDTVVNSKYTDRLETFFKGSIEGMLKNTGGQLLESKNLEMKGYSGRQVKIDYQNGVATIVVQLYLVKNKLILAQVFVKPDKEGNTDQKTFFDSFKIL
ncbi:MAG: hypothetical protein K2P88_00395 [Chitinophagaceae bacterium]|nr:hypothetical protein [Chitinophagaceae bacterium]